MRRCPSGFLPLSLAVLCERCAAYMLASSMVLMLCERYGYAGDEALRMAGLFGAAGYFGSLPGGVIADRVLGHRRALGFSLVLLTAGYVALTQPSQRVLGLALGLLMLGNSLFKPTVQAVMSQLYPATDPRLETAQIWLHLVINIGAGLGAFGAGLVTQRWGFGTTFAIAGAVMLLGRTAVAIGHRSLPSGAVKRQPETVHTQVARQSRLQLAKTIGALTLAMLLFNVCSGQVEGSLLLWAQQHADRVLFGYVVPPSWFVGLPAVLVLLLAPVQLMVLPKVQRHTGTRRLVALGLLATSLAFVVLLPAVLLSKTQLVSMAWLVACLTLIVIGETLITSLGLAQVLRLAPPRLVGAVAGVWFISGALGLWLAGEIGALWFKWSPVGGLILLAIIPLLGVEFLWKPTDKE